MTTRLGLLRVLIFVSALSGASAAVAAVPATVGIQGRLTNAAGGPVSDGAYAVTFRLYGTADAQQATWVEAVSALDVKGGTFKHGLGSTQKLDASVLEEAKGSWLGLQVGTEPELSRTKVQSVPFAVRTLVAEGLACSGCVTVGMVDPQVLAGFAKTADLAAYVKASDLAAYATAASLANVAKTGSYADLNGLPVLAKVGTACGSGLFVKGILADGGLDCGAALIGGKCVAGEVVTEVKADGSVVCGAVQAQLPADGLAAVSNGLLTNVFDEVYASTTTPTSIPDNNPGGIIDEIIVPDTGIVKEINVSLDIQGQETSSLVVTLFDPDNQAYVLHNKGNVGQTLTTSYPAPTKLVSGDLTTWIGKNPKGTWRLIVADWAGGGAIGALKGWSVNFKVLSGTKVALGLYNGELRPTKRITTKLQPGVPLAVSGLQSTAIIVDIWTPDPATDEWVRPADSRLAGSFGTGSAGYVHVTKDQTLPSGTYDVVRLRIDPGTTLKFSGTAPVVFRSLTIIEILGTIDISGAAGGASPTQGEYLPAVAGKAGGFSGNSPLGGNPGPGAGNNGASCTCSSCGGPLSGGGTYKGVDGGVLSGEFVGGSGGGSGGPHQPCDAPLRFGAGGGAGGGAIHLVGPAIVVAGKIVGNGGNGGSASLPAAYAGSGGSGGAVWLSGLHVDLTNGTIEVKGGLAGNSTAGAGTAGGLGVIRIDAETFIAGTSTVAPAINKSGFPILGPFVYMTQPSPGTLSIWPLTAKAQVWSIAVTF